VLVLHHDNKQILETRVYGHIDYLHHHHLRMIFWMV
jgi:hypothetical protein